MKRVPRSFQEKTVREVLDWYEIQEEIVSNEKGRALAEITIGNAPSNSRLLGMTDEEIDSFFLLQGQELELLTMLGLLSAAEAAIRLDYLDRVENRWKDRVSKHFQTIHKKLSARGRAEKVSLEEHILDTWKALVPQAKNPVGEFKGALELRNWLAHGRYWARRPSRRYTPNDVYDIAHQLLQVLSAN